MSVQLIGIDCATLEKKTGVALAAYDAGAVRVEHAGVGGPVLERIAGHLRGDLPALLALDAPLGWPSGMGESLRRHRAGEPLPMEPNRLFRRETDRWVWAQTGKLPLDVGADRIARTAHAALTLLQRVREVIGQPIPLAWSPEDVADLAAIEVYPAATLTVCGIRATGYKAPHQRPAREEIVGALREHLTLGATAETAIALPDALDAIVCTLAAGHFLSGEARPPEDWALARKEGWIWVRGPGEG